MARCSCEDGTWLIYSCSGASDVGELADRVTRHLVSAQFASKSCLAGVGAGHSGYVQSALGADENIVIDGCAKGCGRTILEKAGVKTIPVVLTELGCEKGKTPVTDDLIARIADEIRERVRARISGALADEKPLGGPRCQCGN